jgi:hypothetical protein
MRESLSFLISTGKGYALRSIVAGGTWRSARSSVHPLPEVLEPRLGDVDVRLWQLARPLLDGVEEDEQVPRPLVQDPIEVSPVVATKLAELAIDLRSVRKGEGRVVASHPIEQADLIVDLLLPFGGQAVDEIVDGLNAVAVPVVHGLHDGSLGTDDELGDFRRRSAVEGGREAFEILRVL